MTFEQVAPELGIDACAAHGRNVWRLTMVAQRNDDEKIWPIEVVQIGAEAVEPVALGTNAVKDGEVIARGEKDLALWPSTVEVATVAACGGRPLVVEHEGRSMSLRADGSPSDQLAGSHLAGSWTLRSPLSSTEVAQPSMRPKALKVLVGLRCHLDAK